MDDLDQRIRLALGRVHDPCSVAAGRATSILAMGLVPGWRREGAILHIRFGVTFAGCTMAPHFVEAARSALLAIPGIEEVLATIDTQFVWTPDLMPPRPMAGEPQAWRRGGKAPG